jgi:hypothetical protein
LGCDLVGGTGCALRVIRPLADWDAPGLLEGTRIADTRTDDGCFCGDGGTEQICRHKDLESGPA